MFLNSVKFCCNGDLLNQTLVRHISRTSNKFNGEISNFSRNNNRNVAKMQQSSQKQPKLIFGRKYITDRNFSTHSSHDIIKARHMASEEENEEFMSLFPILLSDFISFNSAHREDTPEMSKHLEKLLQFNVPTGMKFRGLGLVAAYKMIESPENLNSKNIRLANILGWCVEMLRTYLVIYEDIIDKSEKRRGSAPWYKVKGIGLRGLNDGSIIDSGLYMILQKYFADHSNYVQILETLHDVTLKSLLGESIALMSMKDDKPDFEFFTMKKFKEIAKFKTAYSTTYLPIALALNLAQKYDEKLLNQAKDILLEVGVFYQVQNDFLNCFGNPEGTGKTGNDIREGKCTWLAVTALQRADPEQIKVFQDHYGKGRNDESEKIVRELYEKLGLSNIYTTYEEESLNLLHTRIGQLSKELPHALFHKFVENIYGR